MTAKLILAFFLLGVAYAADTCAPDCEDGDEGLYPHPQNCTLYYQCAFSNAVIEYCPPGLEFNPELLLCDYPESAGCTADPDLDCGEDTTTSQSPPTLASSVVPTSLPPPTTTLQQSEATEDVIVSETSAPVTENPTICFLSCPSVSATFANPKDCSTYFKCVGGLPYLLTCSPGEEFNPDAGTCQEADSFECTAGPDQPCVAVI